MNNKTMQYILGYLIGGSLVLVLIPFGIIRTSMALDPVIAIQLIPLSALRYILSILLLAIAIPFAVSSLVVQNSVGKGGPLEAAGIEISPKTENLVVTGPYKYTRNPMLFGACMLYYSLAVYLNSISALTIVFLFNAFMLIFVKLSEEKRLVRDFGKEYLEYRQKVSMFFPWREKKLRIEKKK